MSQPYIDHFADVNAINLHYIEYTNDKPKLLFLHGLTANAHCFEGLINAGLTNHFSILSVDQRGRGLSSKEVGSFSIQDHASDIIALLDQLKIKQIILAGHSFGGLMAAYLAYHYPTRFSTIILLDAAPEMNPKTPEMLASTLSRLDKKFVGFNQYITSIQKAPFMEFWDDAMLAYYKADISVSDDGSVIPKSRLADIIQIATSVAKENWKECFFNFTQQSMLFVAVDPYTLGEPLLLAEQAQAAVSQMRHCLYKEVSGNHHTMLYGKGAQQIVDEIILFVQ